MLLLLLLSSVAIVWIDVLLLLLLSQAVLRDESRGLSLGLSSRCVFL